MVKQHPAFEWPSDEGIRIWRYMDFTKFVSMLENSGLFFARCHKLDDPFEGSYARANVAHRRALLDNLPVPAEIRDLWMREQSRSARWFRQWVMVNCWHMNEHESAGLWKLYGRTDDAICIQSRFSKLRDSLEDNVHIGIVQYIDYENAEIPDGNIFYPFLNKRKSFEHEHELRAVILEIPNPSRDRIIWDAGPPDDGIWKPVALGELVETVFVAPSAAPWFVDLVKSVVGRYELTFDVVRSSLEAEPFF